MTQQIETVFGTLLWHTDEEGVEFEIRGRRQVARWEEITGAALVRTSNAEKESGVPTEVMEEIGQGLPGLGRLMGVNVHMAENYRQLVLARGRSARRAIRMPVPVDDPGAHELVQRIEQRLGDRWKLETDMANHYQALGIHRPWWTIPVSILFIVGLGYIVAFACAGFSALSEGNLDLPPLIWIGMATWLIIVGGIVFLYRRIWWRAP
jgi:hypothetical protein